MTKLSFPHRYELGEAVKSVCRKIDGVAVYDEGHSDATVAAAMPFPATHDHVGEVRRQLVGPMRVPAPPGGPPSINALAQRVARLEIRVATLLEKLGEDGE